MEDNGFPILAGIGKYNGRVGEDGEKILDKEILADMKQALAQEKNVFNEDRFVGYFSSSRGGSNLLIMSGLKDINSTDEYLLDLFMKNVSIAQDNIELNMDIESTQQEIVYLLGEAVETRSKETGNHVKRVAEISGLLARKYGLSEEESYILKLASPLHDLGKIGIPDAILNKPGRHTDDERLIMKTHAELGQHMLRVVIDKTAYQDQRSQDQSCPDLSGYARHTSPIVPHQNNKGQEDHGQRDQHW